MKPSLRIAFLAFALLSLGASARAEVVTLINGDRLTGVVERREEGKILLHSDLAGEVTIAAANVRSLETTDAASVAPPAPAPAVKPPSVPKTRWSGDLSTSLNILYDANKTRSANLYFSPRRESRTDRIALESAYNEERVNRTTTVENWRIRGDYSLEPGAENCAFPFLNGGLWGDRFDRLARRSTLGGGAGREWKSLRGGPVRLRLEVGGAWLKEEYVRYRPRSRGVAQLGYSVEAKPAGLTLMHDLTFYPAPARPSEYYLFTKISLRRSLGGSAYIDTRAEYEYDTDPAPGERKATRRLVVGLGTKL